MTLVDHLYELRYRLGVALIVVAVTGVAGFVWFEHTIWPLPTLGELMTGPYCALPAEQRLSPNNHCQLLQTKPFEVFMLRLKVGVAAGAVLAAPIWLYQVWAFITPGLYAKERKFAGTFVSFATVLFAAGAVLAYLVVPKALEFMAGFGGGEFFTALTGSEYVNFVLLLLVIFGISFELPLLVVMLNRAGVLSYAKLVSWWRGIVFGLCVFAAIATPGQDPISMLALASALSALFGLSVLICRRHDRKAAGAELTDLDPDEPSKIDTRSSELDGVSSLDGPSSRPDSGQNHDDVT